MKRMGISQGKPLADMRNFIKELRAVPRTGDLPPIALATLRKKMIALSEEIAEGMVFANGARSHMADSLSVLGAHVAIERRVLHRQHDSHLHQRRRRSGQGGQSSHADRLRDAAELSQLLERSGLRRGDGSGRSGARARRNRTRWRNASRDRWLADTTLFGSKSKVRDGIEAWFDAGIKTPIIVPSSAVGNQLKAFEEFFAIWK